MASYQIGDLAQLNITFTDVNGNPVDPTTVTLTVQAPDGMQQIYNVPPIVRTGVGTYYYNLTLSEAGNWLYNWQGTGAVVVAQGGTIIAAATPFAANPIDLTTLVDVKMDLSITNSNSDVILARLITSCSAFITQASQRPGFGMMTFNEVRNGNGAVQLPLLNYPARLNDPNWSTTINSVTVNTIGVSKSPDGVQAGWANDLQNVYLVGGCFLGGGAWMGAYPGIFPKGKQNVIVNYTCGYAVIPYEISQACVEAVAQKYTRRTHRDQDSQKLGDQVISFSKKDFAPEIWTVIQSYTPRAPIQ